MPTSAVPSDRVAVVVLTWNGRDDTMACLESLGAVTEPPLDVIVVDNDSTDGTAEAIGADFPEVTVVRNPHNLGFAGGNNVGIQLALERGAPYVFLLNNDACVRPDSIRRLLRHARETPDAGAISPLVVFADRPEVAWYAGAVFDPARGRSGRMLGYRRPVRDLGLDAARDTGRAVGAAMLVSASAIERAGLMDSELFFLYEDVDWSLRIRRAGFRVLMAPDAVVEHKVAASQGGAEITPTTLYYGTRNHLAVCQRHAPMRRLRGFRRASVILATHLRQAVVGRAGVTGVRAVLSGFRDARRGRLGAAA